jgi:putative ABC transport system permease protein
MSVWHLVLREIGHRKLTFVLTLLSVTVAIGCLIGALALLTADQIRTDEIIAERQAKVEEASRALEDETRKIMLGLGFNVLILPETQDLNELHAEGTLSATMPEEYAKTLSESRIVTVNHLLPMLTTKMKWEEMENQTIIIVGTRGEVPIMHRKPKKPLLDHVPVGKMIVGYQVHTRNELEIGSKVKLLGQEFEITACYDERGTSDDSTVWLNLTQAQEMLGKENLVHAILALGCNCATEDRVAEIRAEIGGVLPGTQVIERGPPALARAEARNKAAKAAKDALVREEEHRKQIREQREEFASVLVPIVIFGCAVWISVLAFGNVRHRRFEIGVLRAIGLRSTQILTIFLGKALLVGLIGGAVGYIAGLAVAVNFGDLPPVAETWSTLFSPNWLVAAIVVAPLLSGLSSWLPAMFAARQDPAIVLQGE